MTLTKTVVAKLAVAFVAISMMAFAVVPAQAQTVEELQAQIDALMAQISALGGGSMSTSSACPYTWTRSLTQGDTGADVMALQKFLNGSADTKVAVSGAGSTGSETSFYGPATAAAVSNFQVKYRTDILSPVGLVNATGFFGPSTMAKANALCVSSTGTGTGTGSTVSGDLEGGAGSVDTWDVVSSLSNEEVGEGEEDVEVAGLQVENSDDSDIEIRAVKLVFAQGTAGSKFVKYADEVSVWVDGEEFARLDASDFTSNNSYTKTVSLDSGAVIKAGDTGEVVVAISGISNLDSADAGDTWIIDFTSVRFEDAQGSIVSEDPTVSPVTFSFETFATSANIEFKINSGDNAINDGQSIAVSSTTDTNGVEILSFEVTAEGNSDLTIDALPITFTGSVGLSYIFNTAELWIDGELVGSEATTTTSTSGTQLFDNLDWTLAAGETVEVVVKVDVNNTDSNFVAGSTLYAEIGETETDMSIFDIVDENDDDLLDGNKTGSESSEAHVFYTDGVSVVENDVSAVATAGSNDDDDYVTLTIKFDVTAYGSDVYVPNFASSTKGTTATGATPTTGDGVLVHLQSADTDLTAVTPVISSTATEETNSFLVKEGDTETFTIKATVANSATSTLDNAAVRMILAGVNFGDTDSATGDYVFTSSVSDIKTDYEVIVN